MSKDEAMASYENRKSSIWRLLNLLYYSTHNSEYTETRELLNLKHYYEKWIE